MTKTNKRLCLAAALLLIALQLLSLASCSAEAVIGYDDPAYIQWRVSADGKTLKGDKTYTLYELDEDYIVDSRNTYYFYNSVYYENDENEFFGEVYGYRSNSNIVWVDGWEETYIYVTKTGKEILDEYTSGTDVRYYLEVTEFHASITTFTVAEMEKQRESDGEKMTVEVTALKDAARFEIIARDGASVLKYKYGMIYRLEGSYYYLHYASLGNEHFDADGNFSYRSGSVELTKLAGAASENVAFAIEHMDYGATRNEWEGENGYSSSDMQMPISVFWAFYFIVCFLIPGVLLALGIALPHAERLGKPKHWYILAVVAAAWIFIAIILAIVLMVF